MLTRTDFISSMAAMAAAPSYLARDDRSYRIRLPKTFEGHKLPLYWCALRAQVFGDLRFPASYMNLAIREAEYERTDIHETAIFHGEQLLEASQRLGVKLRYESWEQLREDALRTGLILDFYVHELLDTGSFSKWTKWIDSYVSAYPTERNYSVLNTISAAEGGNACALDWLYRTGVWERLSMAIAADGLQHAAGRKST